MKTTYLILTLAGFVLPLAIFFGLVGDFAPVGDDLLGAFFANRAAAAASADVLLASLVFWIWAFADARASGVMAPWYLIPINMVVGLCAALPLYLWLRLPSGDRAA